MNKHTPLQTLLLMSGVLAGTSHSLSRPSIKKEDNQVAGTDPLSSIIISVKRELTQQDIDVLKKAQEKRVRKLQEKQRNKEHNQWCRDLYPFQRKALKDLALGS